MVSLKGFGQNDAHAFQGSIKLKRLELLTPPSIGLGNLHAAERLTMRLESAITSRVAYLDLKAINNLEGFIFPED